MSVIRGGMAIPEEIRKRREQLGWGQGLLAEKVGTTQQTVWRIENGETTHSRFLPKILAVLDLSDTGATTTAETTIVPKQMHRASDRGDLPIYAAAEGGPGEMIRSYEPIDYKPRPDPLLAVKDGYGMYIVGESMSPAFEQGDMALVNPHLPFRRGNDVLIFSNIDQEVAVIVKRLVKATPDLWEVVQFNPAKTFTLRRSEWPGCHVIVGKYARS